jgi:diguanylate cyclase (GGDEF)-like protein
MAHACLARETTDALQYVTRLAAAACRAEAAALVAVHGDEEQALTAVGIDNYTVPKHKGLLSQLPGLGVISSFADEQLRTAGVEFPFANDWPQWVWQLRRIQPWGNGETLIWIARSSKLPFLPEEIHAFELCAELAERELTFLARHKDIVLQRELATVEIAHFHEQLSRQHLLYRELAKHLPGTAVLVFDVDLHVRIQEGWRALDWPCDNGNVQTGHLVTEHFASHDAGRIDAACRKAIDRQHDTFEIRLKNRCYELSAGPLPDPSGTVVFGILVVRDVTEDREKRTESAAVTARLEALVESLDDGILVEDEHRQVQLCSNRLRELMQFDTGGVSNVTRDGHELMTRMASVCFIPEAFEESTSALIASRTAKRNELVYLADMRIIERDYVPLSVENRSVGHLWVYRDVTQREVGKDSLQRQADEQRALSLVDELTGLYNRRGFLTLATQQLKLNDRTLSPALIVFVDLDGMKRINDELGHEFGDQALIETSNVLRHCFRHSDVIARLGGDEFVALAIDASPDTCISIEQRLYEALAENNGKPNRSFELQFSIGIAPYDPSSAEMVEEVLARADALMYEHKRARKAERKA